MSALRRHQRLGNCSQLLGLPLTGNNAPNLPNSMTAIDGIPQQTLLHPPRDGSEKDAAVLINSEAVTSSNQDPDDSPEEPEDEQNIIGVSIPDSGFPSVQTGDHDTVLAPRGDGLREDADRNGADEAQASSRLLDTLIKELDDGIEDLSTDFRTWSRPRRMLYGELKLLKVKGTLKRNLSHYRLMGPVEYYLRIYRNLLSALHWMTIEDDLHFTLLLKELTTAGDYNDGDVPNEAGFTFYDEFVAELGRYTTGVGRDHHLLSHLRYVFDDFKDAAYRGDHEFLQMMHYLEELIIEHEMKSKGEGHTFCYTCYRQRRHLLPDESGLRDNTTITTQLKTVNDENAALKAKIEQLEKEKREDSGLLHIPGAHYPAGRIVFVGDLPPAAGEGPWTRAGGEEPRPLPPYNQLGYYSR